MKNTAICDACGKEYEFSNAYTDRCPICCPKEMTDDIWRDDLMPDPDWSDIPDEPAE